MGCMPLSGALVPSALGEFNFSVPFDSAFLHFHYQPGSWRFSEIALHCWQSGGLLLERWEGRECQGLGGQQGCGNPSRALEAALCLRAPLPSGGPLSICSCKGRGGWPGCGWPGCPGRGSKV